MITHRILHTSRDHFLARRAAERFLNFWNQGGMVALMRRPVPAPRVRYVQILLVYIRYRSSDAT